MVAWVSSRGMAQQSASAKAGGMSRLQKLALWSLVVLLIASVAARAAFLSTQPARSGGSSSAIEPSSYLASTKGDSAAADDEQAGALEKALPYVTEGSLFGLIGFALGYATRKVFKLGLLLIALAFIAIQTLTYFDLVNVEWGPVVAWINKALLNLKENESFTQFLTKRVPSVGALLAGYVFGFQRG